MMLFDCCLTRKKFLHDLRDLLIFFTRFILLSSWLYSWTIFIYASYSPARVEWITTHITLSSNLYWNGNLSLQATLIVNNVHLHILPSMNPDGFSLRQRGNANNIDLNRDFPDQVFCFQHWFLIWTCLLGSIHSERRFREPFFSF